MLTQQRRSKRDVHKTSISLSQCALFHLQVANKLFNIYVLYVYAVYL